MSEYERKQLVAVAEVLTDTGSVLSVETGSRVDLMLGLAVLCRVVAADPKASAETRAMAQALLVSVMGPDAMDKQVTVIPT